MQELRARQIAHVAQGRHQLLDVVAIHRADVIEAELFEIVPGRTMPFIISSERRASSHIVGICLRIFLPPERSVEYMRPDSTLAK